ncbi:MAG: hypothetical protein ABMA02_03790 [Saprospiraceae bacterium]
MQTKKLVFVLALLIGCAAASFGQEYKSAIGLRLGYPVSITYKTFISDPGAIEIFGGFRSWTGYKWFNVAGLYEHHAEVSGVDGLKWYFGGGASVFFWTYDEGFDGGSSTSIGLLGTLGLDYKFADAPINLSADWVPHFFLNGYGSGFGGGYGALSVRYTLN